MITINEILKIVGIDYKISEKYNNIKIKNFSTDTRTIKRGDFYIPLKGEKFNGEDFIEKAVELGAVGYFGENLSNLVIERDNAIGIKVSDTKEAYLKLANWYRKKINPKVVMITGSSGKTTTKELISSVVSQKYNIIKTALNHNNEIGFCQTVFSMNSETEVLIVEAGMRGFGEIELISKYAEPDITVITNVGTAHIGRLGSRENIAKAKCEITSFQNPNGVVIAHDDEIIKKTLNFNGNKLFYSLNDVIFLEKSIGFSKFLYKEMEYELNIEGDYNVENSLAGINVGQLLGIESVLIKKGLKEYKPIEKRWEVENIVGYNIINDSYNANPDSMKATLNTVIELYPNAIIILGDMGELGADEEKYHKNIAEFINSKNKISNIILTVGNLAKNITEGIKVCKSKNFGSAEDVANYITDNIDIGTTIFLKASRAMKFERILEKLKEIKGDNK